MAKPPIVICANPNCQYRGPAKGRKSPRAAIYGTLAAVVAVALGGVIVAKTGREDVGAIVVRLAGGLAGLWALGAIVAVSIWSAGKKWRCPRCRQLADL